MVPHVMSDTLYKCRILASYGTRMLGRVQYKSCRCVRLIGALQ